MDIGAEVRVPAGATTPLVRGRPWLQKTVRQPAVGPLRHNGRTATAEGVVDPGKAGARVPVPAIAVSPLVAALHLDAPVGVAPAGGRHLAEADRVARCSVEASPAAAGHQEGRVDAVSSLVGPGRPRPAPVTVPADLAKDDQGALARDGAAAATEAPRAVAPRLGGEGPGALLGPMAVVAPAEVRAEGEPPRWAERVTI